MPTICNAENLKYGTFSLKEIRTLLLWRVSLMSLGILVPIPMITQITKHPLINKEKIDILHCLTCNMCTGLKLRRCLNRTRSRSLIFISWMTRGLRITSCSRMYGERLYCSIISTKIHNLQTEYSRCTILDRCPIK